MWLLLFSCLLNLCRWLSGIIVISFHSHVNNALCRHINQGGNLKSSVVKDSVKFNTSLFVLLSCCHFVSIPPPTCFYPTVTWFPDILWSFILTVVLPVNLHSGTPLRLLQIARELGRRLEFSVSCFSSHLAFALANYGTYFFLCLFVCFFVSFFHEAI